MGSFAYVGRDVGIDLDESGRMKEVLLKGEKSSPLSSCFKVDVQAVYCESDIRGRIECFGSKRNIP